MYMYILRVCYCIILRSFWIFPGDIDPNVYDVTNPYNFPSMRKIYFNRKTIICPFQNGMDELVGVCRS